MSTPGTSSTINERTPLCPKGNNNRSCEIVSRPEDAKLSPLDIAPSTRRYILAGIWLGMFLSSLNLTLVATLVSFISSEYQAANQASWIGTAFLLAACAFAPLYGRLCDTLGRRAAAQTAIVFAGIGTLCCGLSSNMPMLIASRFLGGIGGGGSFSIVYVITSDMYKLRDRSWTQGIASVFNGAGQGLGGPLGGYINDRFGWRWAFLMQIPLYIISYLLIGYNLNYSTPGQSKSVKETFRRIDFSGSILLLLSIGSFLSFLSFKYNDDLPFNTSKVIMSLVCAILTFIIFIIVEFRVAPEPILVPALLKMKVPVLVGMGNLLISIVTLASIYFLPVYFETVMLTSAASAGAHLLPNSVAMATGSLFAGAIISMTNCYKLLDMISGLGPIIAAVLMSLLDQNSSPVNQWLSIVPLGFGHGVITQTTLIALLAHVDPSIMAVATGFAQFWRCIGQIAGVAIPSAIFQYVLGRELTRRITGPGSSEIISRIRHSSEIVVSLPSEIQQLAKESYGIALRRAFWFIAASAIAGSLVRLGIPDKSLDEPRIPKVETNRPSNGTVTDDIERVVERTDTTAEMSQ